MAPAPDVSAPVKLGLTGGLVVFIFTVVALSGLINLRIASFSFSAIIAVITGVLAWNLVLLHHRFPRPAARAAAPYLVLTAWMGIMGFIAGSTRQGIQFISVQLALVGALLAASIVRSVVGDRLDLVVARCLRVTSVVVFGFQAANHQASSRAISVLALVGLAWYLAEYRSGSRTSLWWALAVLLGIGISLSRTALFAGFVLFAITMVLSPRKRVRNAILCTLVLVGGAWAVSSWAPLHDRFVEGDVSISVVGIDINGEGRTQVWDVLWSGVKTEPLIGHGPGSASLLSFSVNPAFENPHNDYLRILYDFGIVGLVLFARFSLRSAMLLRHAREISPGVIPPRAALNAGLAILIMMATGNPLDYPFVMIPLGTLFGLGLGSGLRDKKGRSMFDAFKYP